MSSTNEQYVYILRDVAAVEKAMKSILEGCSKLGIEPPPEVRQFFQQTFADGMLVELLPPDHPAMKSFDDDMKSGWEVELSKLPPDVKVLRFFHDYD